MSRTSVPITGWDTSECACNADGPCKGHGGAAGSGQFFNPFPGVESEEVNLGAFPCPHDWKLYTGLTKVYEFCEHCDEKRPYEEPIICEPPPPNYKTWGDRGIHPPMTASMIRKGEAVLDSIRYLTTPRHQSIPRESSHSNKMKVSYRDLMFKRESNAFVDCKAFYIEQVTMKTAFDIRLRANIPDNHRIIKINAQSDGVPLDVMTQDELGFRRNFVVY